MRFEGIHHVTCITGERARQRRLLRPRARPAPRQEDRQSGRPDRVPPLLRRRGRKPRRGHHLLRVSRRSPGPGRCGHGAHDRVPRRLGGGPRLLGAASDGRRHRGGPHRRTAYASTTLKGSGSSWSSRPPPTDRCSPSTRRSRQSSHCRASTRFAPSARSRRRAARCSSRHSPSSPSATLPGRSAATDRGGLYAYDPPPASGSGVPGAGTVHHVAWASRLEEQEAWLETLRAAGTHPERHHRPLLVPLHLLPRAERRAVRARHARTGLLDRRGSRAARRVARAAAGVRAPASACGAGAHAAP